MCIIGETNSCNKSSTVHSNPFKRSKKNPNILANIFQNKKANFLRKIFRIFFGIYHVTDPDCVTPQSYKVKMHHLRLPQLNKL